MDYQTGMCDTCPNRHLADLFEQLGDADRATAIREAGCSWWWGVPEENEETGQARIRYQCGAAALPGYLRRYGKDVEGASRQVAAVERRAVETAEQTARLVAVAVRRIETLTEQTGERVERALLAGGGGLVELATRKATPALPENGGRFGQNGLPVGDADRSNEP